MSDFSSNFKDIQNQIFFADLTDQQIQKLIISLETKRSANPKLTKEEKVFFQCCRERRSYANSKDLDTVVCPHCGSIKVIKHGTRNSRQRYFCKDCKKTFGDTNGTVAFRSKLSIAKWIEFIKLTLQGESCRTIARNLGINKQTALHNRPVDKAASPEQRKQAGTAKKTPHGVTWSILSSASAPAFYIVYCDANFRPVDKVARQEKTW